MEGLARPTLLESHPCNLMSDPFYHTARGSEIAAANHNTQSREWVTTMTAARACIASRNCSHACTA